jgi:hypothetical protein
LFNKEARKEEEEEEEEDLVMKLTVTNDFQQSSFCLFNLAT